MDLLVELRRTVIIKAGHKHGPCVIGKIIRGLADGRKKRPKRPEPLAIIECQERNVVWYKQPSLSDRLERSGSHFLRYREDADGLRSLVKS